MSDENQSTLVIKLQRETEPNGGQFINREMRTHFKGEPTSGSHYEAGSVQTFRKIGSRVALVTHYEEGMLETLNVDAVIETPDVALNNPIVIEQTTHNMAGMTLGYDNTRLDPNRSMESVMMVSGGGFQGPVQAGFAPQQEAILPLGKTLDNKAVRLVFQDVRPKPAFEIPLAASLK